MKTSFEEKYGKWALVTGASKGLGLEFARQCAERGLNVVTVARSAELLNEEAEYIRKTYSVEAITIPLDLSREDILDVITPVTDSLEIGLLINNAAISQVQPFLSSTLEQGLNELHLNARASLILAYHFRQGMVERQRGGMIFLSSGSAINGTPYVANYAATKAYNLILAEALWYELKGCGIDVLGFMPGMTRTPGLLGAGPKFKPLLQVMDADETVADALDKLGKVPSRIAGRGNRLSCFAAGKLCRRTWAIRSVAKAMNSIFGPFDQENTGGAD